MIEVLQPEVARYCILYIACTPLITTFNNQELFYSAICPHPSCPPTPHGLVGRDQPVSEKCKKFL